MKTKTTNTSLKILAAVIAVFSLLALVVVLFLYQFPAEKRNDYKRLSSENYNAVFMSMYPTEYFYEEDFAYWRGLTTVRTTYEIPNLSTLKGYLKQIGSSGNTIHTIYLGVLPEELPADELAALLQSYPSVQFEILLPNPSLDYWLTMTEEECADQLAHYRDFILPLLQYGNMSLYFYGANEWLIANPDNYEGHFNLTETAALTIMLNSDRDHPSVLTVERAEEALETLSTLIAKHRTSPQSYPDKSHQTIIFLGDSVIANYEGTLSIPGVVGGLTGAQVFNLGLGGGMATEEASDNCSLTDIVNSVITKDFSKLPLDREVSQDARLYENFSEYSKTETSKDLCFVINYGLNDYFNGLPIIASEDPNDIYTYKGAIRTAVQTLQQAFPDAQILLMTPNFTSYYGNGTEYRFEASHTLKDYADAVIAVSEELDVPVLDNFHELDINAHNHATYLSDGCHPNETGRFLIGQRIALKLANPN